MPRRRPHTLRAHRWRPAPFRPTPRIKGVSALTRLAVCRVEDLHYRPGAVADALDRYARLLHRPGRYLNGDAAVSPGLDPEDARDMLNEVLHRLPRGARADFARVVGRLDDEFVRRTVPAQWWSAWVAGRWWYQRDREL